MAPQRRCAPSPAQAKLRFAEAGEGWGGGKPHTPSPEASAFAEASVDEAAEQAFIITVYEPSLEVFEADYKTKRKS